MIFIFCAIYPEAKAIIEHYGMKKCPDSRYFDSFASEDGHLFLTLTGVGRVAAATAVSHVLTHHMDSEETGDVQVLNVGTAAGTRIGKAYLINSISDDAGRTFYPDLLYKCSLDEAALFSRDRILTEPVCAAFASQEKAAPAHLYDMEGAGIYQAASAYLAPHRVSLIKVVSDNGQRIGADQVTELMYRNIDSIAAYIAELEEDDCDGPEIPGEDVQQLLDKLCLDIHCSAVMKSETEQYARYCLLQSGGQYLRSVIQRLYDEELAPCVDKNMGKRCLNRLKELVL